jgi:hypothetical protein
MWLASVICSVLGAVSSLGASVWLLVGFNPMSARYLSVEGGGYGHIPTTATGVRLLLKDQAKVAFLAVIGGAFQLAGVVLGIYAMRGN